MDSAVEDPQPATQEPIDDRPRMANGLPVPPKWRAGLGRPKGAVSRSTRERREFVEMVFGAESSAERREIALSIRKQFMEGTLSPVIASIVMYWWLGKPKETVELKAAPVDYSEMSDAELAERARFVAELATSTIDVTPQKELEENVTP